METTSRNNYDNMTRAYMEVEDIIKRIERKDIGNISVDKLASELTIITLNANGINTSGKTAKQVRLQVKHWYDKTFIAQYSVEMKGDDRWVEVYYTDSLKRAKAVCEVAMQNADARLRNNYNGALVYKQGANWVEFK